LAENAWRLAKGVVFASQVAVGAFSAELGEASLLAAGKKTWFLPGARSRLDSVAAAPSATSQISSFSALLRASIRAARQYDARMNRSRKEANSSPARSWVGTDAKVIRHVRVCGDGHLAAATRSELERLGIHRDTDYLLPALRPPLVVACGDTEDDDSFGELARRASEEGCPLLLACLNGRVVRIGPLIQSSDECFIAMAPTRRGAKARAPSQDTSAPPNLSPGQTHVAEAHPPGLYARLGALLVSAQTLNFLLGARNQCILDRVVELNPWSMESKSYRVLKVRQ
jgi:hypothetical protein